MPEPVQWGLTGGIASGKSTVAQRFRENGIPVCDLDALGRALLDRDEEVQAGVNALCGNDLLVNGKIDRRKMRERLFADSGLRREVERFLHPRIWAAYQRWVAEQKTPVVLCEAALLVDTANHTRFHGIIVVDAPPQTRLRRLVERDAIAPELAEQMLASQIADEKRNAVATYRIENTGSLDRLNAAVDTIAKQINVPPPG